MQNNIYISTSAFKVKDLKTILELCLTHNLTNLELSFVDYADNNVEQVLKAHKNSSMRFLVHNYFPRPQKDFVLNLASDNEKVIGRSLGHCRTAIDLAAMLGGNFYSFHAGFAFHAGPKDLGRPQIELPRIPYKMAYQNFVRNVKDLAGYARQKKIKLLVENNVVSPFNLIAGKNELLLLADALEAIQFYQDVGADNVLYLIDTGHVKVSANSLGFDAKEYLRKLCPYTGAFHLSDNNGRLDQNWSFDEQVWFRDVIRENKDKTFVIEAQGLEIDEIKKCYRNLENILLGKQSVQC